MTGMAGELNHLHSTPALAAALRQMAHVENVLHPVALPALRRLSPMYRIQGGSIETEAHAAAQVVGEIAERMRRLTTAYSEWQAFDISAYFDLPPAFSGELIRIVERVSTVHVLFFVDPLLPSFQTAAQFWESEFMHAYQHLNRTPEEYRHFVEELQQAMVDHWERLIAVLQTARGHLLDDIGFLTTSGAADERMRWQAIWRRPPAAGLRPELTPDLRQIPTLTLALDFPLPAQKQPGRIRRLRRSRERRRNRRQRY